MPISLKQPFPKLTSQAQAGAKPDLTLLSPRHAAAAPIFYGRRRGRRLNQELAVEAEQGLTKLTVTPHDWLTWQGSIWLEIGIGSGEHLLMLAKENPDQLYIGAEAYINGVAKASRDANRDGLSNVRLWPDDARLIMAQMPAGLLSGLMVMFPDPWPKRRHFERRLMGPSLWPEFARLLKAGGELRLASDHADYIAWAMHHAPLGQNNQPASFVWENNCPGAWQQRPPTWPATRYEKKRLAGAPVWLQFRRLATLPAVG